MKIGLITTLDTNIGDDFIREGICRLLRSLLKPARVDFIAVNKHLPWTVYPAWHPANLCRMTRALPRGADRAERLIQHMTAWFGKTRFDDCDLIVQCGAPVLWPGCHRTPWRFLLWDTMVRRLHTRTPVLNLAAGSCYGWSHPPTRIVDPEEVKYLRTIFDYCRLTTVRDRLARDLLMSLGREATFLPCTAFLAAEETASSDFHEDDPLLVNYMPGGGHRFHWMKEPCEATWRQTMTTLVQRLRDRHRVVMLCHDSAEYEVAQQVAPGVSRLWPRTPREYLSLTIGAKAALCNRMHACVGLAGQAIPSVAVGDDTRLLMAEALGLPVFCVEDVSVSLLEDAIEKTIANRREERSRLMDQRQRTFTDYVGAIGGRLPEMDRSR